ncbi:MAG: FkbM family methyltransferase [Rhabdochlamydiaceae bacterium]|nr:FkbM family methyltransferase [Candidatus Amphrikana amoebophyrae]
MANKFISFLLLSLTFIPSVFAQYYSQCNQDQFVHTHFFQNKKNGVFIDIGAHDGVQFSNTYFLENELGWTGLCIEPIPDVFNRLKNNRKAICIQGCIDSSHKNKEIDFLRIHGNPPDLEMFSGILEYYDQRHVNKILQRIALLGGSAEVIKVKCFDLNELLRLNDIDHVDFLSLDTEGGEFEILSSIDFNKVNIDVIAVENNYKNPCFKQFLEPLGYQLITTLEQDEIYKKREK